MSTGIDHEEQAQETVGSVEEQSPVLEELLEFKLEHVHGDMTPCPACNLLVPISARQCHHCNSNIAANNALVRETLRHVDEIAAGLDGESRVLDRAWRSLKNRIKRLFGGKATLEGIVPEADPRRLLTGINPGEQVTVVQVYGAWARVRTDDDREGWVYTVPGSGP